MKVLLVTAECAPFAKVGGVADVVAALAPELNKIGVDARVIMPLHSQIKAKYDDSLEHVCNFFIHMGWRSQFVGVKRMEADEVTYYFIDNEYYFGGPVYKGGNAEGEQYAFFSRAVLSVLEFIEFIPDIVHVNDWQTAMIPMLIKTQYADAPQGKIRTILTIHNLMYQGKFAQDFACDLLGIDYKYMTSEFMEAYGCANFLKAGLVFADKLTTVSPTYSREILHPYFSEGMEGILNARSHQTVGILNGIDVGGFDPKTDSALSDNYSVTAMSGKQKCKKALIKELGLNIKDTTPIIGMVSRLTSQKGIDLIKCIFHELMFDELAVVVLGSGDVEYEQFFLEQSREHPGKVSVRTEYNDALARRIYAGSDLFLMPSKFEPCGISQMIAMRYGALPIVRETGGLVDTVLPYDKNSGEGTGFTFSSYNAHDMLHVIRMALCIFWDKPVWKILQKNAMKQDFSFNKSAKEYVKLYEDVLNG